MVSQIEGALVMTSIPWTVVFVSGATAVPPLSYEILGKYVK